MDKYFKGSVVDLEPFEEKHVEVSREWINDEDITLYMEGRFPVGVTEQKVWYKKLLIDKTKKKLIVVDKYLKNVGMVSLLNIDHKNQNAEIGIYIDTDEQGKGYAKEAISMLLNFAFKELNMHKIYAFIYAINNSSRKLFETVGFFYEYTDAEAVYSNGKFVDICKYSIFRKR